ncbi:MAG TPA: hypothetical protein VHO69_03925 [Phototrophicaceae bacterium]|nr:hypothetical protein [Phototrophicaceae bacterium]
MITPTRFVVYNFTIYWRIFSFTPEQLQWVGLPDAYNEGYNQFWLHVEKEGKWYVLQIRGYKYNNRRLLLALRRFAFDRTDQVGAYRRRRGDIHFGPVQAEPAAQDIHGAWTLAVPVNLYLMPRYLVILQGNTVLRKIPVTTIQEIGALRRLDEPSAAGLVRFRAEEETFAFALAQHEALAEALATAAKRTLEEPLERKQKALDDDDLEDEDWLDEFEASEPPRKNQAG